MRIARLELKNIGVFAEQTIEFLPKTVDGKAEIHILTGINGSGKSTILYALASAFSLGSGHIQRRLRYRDERSQLQVTLLNSTEMPIQLDIGYSQNNPFRYLNHYPLIDNYRESLQRNLEAIQDQEFEFAVFAYSGARTLFSSSIGAIQELATNPLQNSLHFQESVNPNQLVQWIANTKAKIAFAQQEQNLRLAARYQTALERIEHAVAEIVGYKVEFLFRYEPLAVGVKVNERELEFDLLPDGLKSIISWIADLLMRLDRLKWVDNCDVLDRNFILFLDEIEIHLHPAWQRRILPVIQKLFKNAQIFIATHSPFVVASVSDAWVYRFRVVDGQSILDSVEPSMAGSSYMTVLDEVFGIEEEFDVETERAFQTFESLKRQLLQGDQHVLPQFTDLARQLAAKSVEVQDIVGREIKQLERITNLSIPL